MNRPFSHRLRKKWRLSELIVALIAGCLVIHTVGCRTSQLGPPVPATAPPVVARLPFTFFHARNSRDHAVLGWYASIGPDLTKVAEIKRTLKASRYDMGPFRAEGFIAGKFLPDGTLLQVYMMYGQAFIDEDGRLQCDSTKDEWTVMLLEKKPLGKKGDSGDKVD